MFSYSDLVQIAELNRTEFHPDERLSSPETIRDWIQDNNGAIMLTRDGSIVTAYIAYYRTGDTFTIHRKATRPDYRRQGLAVRLQVRLLRKARKLNCEVSTYTARENLTVVNYNARLGFRIIKIGKRWVKMLWRPNIHKA